MKWILFTFPAILILTFSALGQQKKFSDDMIKRPKEFRRDLEKAFNIVETPVYRKDTSSRSLLLLNGYALSNIQNPEEIKKLPENAIVNSVNIIFTKYPQKKEQWLSDYHILLSERLRELFKLNARLNDADIAWNIILQSNCRTAQQANAMVHGIEIEYELPIVIVPEVITENKVVKKDSIAPPATETKAAKNQQQKLKTFINALGHPVDSTITIVLNRHPEWMNSLIVMDWTYSMHPYGGQLMQWLTNNQKSGAKRNLVFFNDGGNKKRKKVGRTGGIYYTTLDNIPKVITVMTKVKSEGAHNRDTEENDVEAIIRGIRRFTDFSEVILLADNASCMRDFCLIKYIDVPVKVIVCGGRDNLNPQYLNLAYRTGGSIHTIESDIESFEHLKTNPDAEILGTKYKYSQRKNRFDYRKYSFFKRHQNCTRFYRRKKCDCPENGEK